MAPVKRRKDQLDLSGAMLQRGREMLPVLEIHGLKVFTGYELASFWLRFPRLLDLPLSFFDGFCCFSHGRESGFDKKRLDKQTPLHAWAPDQLLERGRGSIVTLARKNNHRTLVIKRAPVLTLGQQIHSSKQALHMRQNRWYPFWACFKQNSKGKPTIGEVVRIIE